MKQLILLIAIIIFTSQLSLSQNQGISAKGGKLGINISNVSGDDTDELKSKVGLTLGGFLTYDINESWAVQPELLYSMKGCNYEVKSKTKSTNLNYLEIPVAAKYKIAMEGDMKPSVYAGPALGILLSADSDGTDVKDQLNTIDFGLVLGAGVSMDKLSGDLRYTLGLAKLNKEGDDKNTNGVFSIIVGYAF